MSSEIMLEECFDGRAPDTTSQCGCNLPHKQTDLSYDLPGESDETRTFTATCGYCGEGDTFLYKRQADGSWCMIDD